MRGFTIKPNTDTFLILGILSPRMVLVNDKVVTLYCFANEYESISLISSMFWSSALELNTSSVKHPKVNSLIGLIRLVCFLIHQYNRSSIIPTGI